MASVDEFGVDHSLYEDPPKDAKKVVPHKVVTGKVVRRKKSFGQKVKALIFSDDGRTVARDIVQDVLVPAVKDIISNSVDAALYRGAKPQKRGGTSRTNYVSFSDDRRRPSPSIESRARHDFDEITISTRPEAEEVLDTLRELIDTYGNASVADFYELVGVSSVFTDNKYGWKSLNTARVVRSRDGGFVIELPKTVVLD